VQCVRCRQKLRLVVFQQEQRFNASKSNAWKFLCANDINKGMSIIRQITTKAGLDYDVIHDDIPALCRLATQMKKACMHRFVASATKTLFMCIKCDTL